MRAHDVRRLRICPACQEMGDLRNMIAHTDQPIEFHTERYYHGGCFVSSFGEEALLTLPISETDRLTLRDIGAEMMRKLLDVRAGLESK